MEFIFSLQEIKIKERIALPLPFYQFKKSLYKHTKGLANQKDIKSNKGLSAWWYRVALKQGLYKETVYHEAVRIESKQMREHFCEVGSYSLGRTPCIWD